MSRTGENIYKRKDGRWEGRYIKERTISGKAVYGYVYAKSYRDVKEKLTQIKTNFENPQNPYFIYEQKDSTFYSVASEWLKKRVRVSCKFLSCDSSCIQFIFCPSFI